MANIAENDLPLYRRLWIYQSERIPLLKTSILLAVFSAASINVSAFLSGRDLPGYAAYATAFIVSLVLFIQLRACDEYKDGPDDMKYRPERPIPRGLVSLKTVLTIGWALVPVALIATFLYHPPLLLLLGLVWFWLALMTVEFFVPEWLKARALLYLVSHMAIMPLLDLFVTGAEWVPAAGEPAPALSLFLALSFMNGCVLEIGRKIFAPENEREGVDTYSKLWGINKAIIIWMGSILLSFLLLCTVGLAMGFVTPVAAAGGIMAFFCLRAASAMAEEPSAKHRDRLDLVSGLWVFVCYFAAGFIPLIVTFVRSVL
ncbi:MAG: UbiA family prenyltransferase [Pseudomonadota bacterium]